MIYHVEVKADGTQIWRYNGKIHREGDLPAVIWANGDVAYWKDGKRHRDGDQPAVIYANGTVQYWKDGEIHRDGDQPAVIWADGSVSYWKHDKKYTPKPKAECAGKVVEIEGVKYILTPA